MEEIQEIYEASIGQWELVDPNGQSAEGDGLAVGLGLPAVPTMPVFETMFDRLYQTFVLKQHTQRSADPLSDRRDMRG